MEGAVVSAQIAAKELAHDEGLLVAGPELPPEYPRPLLRLLVKLTAPLAALAWLRTRWG